MIEPTCGKNNEESTYTMIDPERTVSFQRRVRSCPVDLHGMIVHSRNRHPPVFVSSSLVCFAAGLRRGKRKPHDAENLGRVSQIGKTCHDDHRDESLNVTARFAHIK